MIAHRALRDVQRCEAKYGEAWQEYKQQVPYLFIPVSIQKDIHQSSKLTSIVRLLSWLRAVYISQPFFHILDSLDRLLSIDYSSSLLRLRYRGYCCNKLIGLYIVDIETLEGGFWRGRHIDLASKRVTHHSRRVEFL